MKITVFADGGARGNPGPAAYGFAVLDKNESIIHEEGEKIGEATNNIAEYTAVLKALSWINDNLQGVEKIDFYLDSELITKQLNGDYKIKNKALKEKFEKIVSLKKNQKNVTFTHILREKNTIADALVNKALDAVKK